MNARQDVQEVSIEHGSIEDILPVKVFVDGIELALTSFNTANGYSTEQYFMTPYLDVGYEYEVILEFSDILNSHPVFALEGLSVEYILQTEINEEGVEEDILAEDGFILWESNLLKLSNTVLPLDQPYVETGLKEFTSQQEEGIDFVPEIKTSVFPCFLSGPSRFEYLLPDLFTLDHDTGEALEPQPEVEFGPENMW